jgi:serine/threonine protein kinase
LEQSFPSIASLRTQFLEGVNFLHDHGVAHLDLKPDNVLVNDTLTTTPRLSITDFDTAEFVTGVEIVIVEQRGTRGWMATEVEANKGLYSPVLADRWSCRKMPCYFAKYLSPDEEMRKFARKLLDEDPQSRPALEFPCHSTF